MCKGVGVFRCIRIHLRILATNLNALILDFDIKKTTTDLNACILMCFFSRRQLGKLGNLVLEDSLPNCPLIIPQFAQSTGQKLFRYFLYEVIDMVTQPCNKWNDNFKNKK